MNHLTPTRLDRLELKNFRCFSNLVVEFHPRLTVIVASNGGGKTALLDAIGIAWRLFVNTLQTKQGSSGFDHADIRMERSAERTMEAILPTSLKAVGVINKDPLDWSREIESNQPRAKTTIADAGRLKNAATNLRKQLQGYVEKKCPDAPTLPLIAYYGTGRLFGAHKLTMQKKQKGTSQTTRMNGYEDCLSSVSRYKYFVDWFERFSREAQQESSNGHPSPHLPKQKLQAVRDAVDAMLAPSGWHSLSWDFAEGKIHAEHPEHGALPVDCLSDGIRNMIGMVADIAHRCVRLNPHLEANAARQTHGIVLIDEIDMHLHPAWQQTVIQSLLDAFPTIQFIVTTHSPQVLTTVKRESIRILDKDTDGTWIATQPAEETKGVESSTALSDVFGVNSVPPVEEASWLNEYTALIENGIQENEAGRALRSKLTSHFGDAHPLIRDFDRLIRFQAFKLRRPKASEV